MIRRESISNKVRKSFLGAIMTLIVIICAIVLPSSRNVEAASNFCNVYVDIINETPGKIVGTVGQEIEPYYFTITVHRYLDTHENYYVEGVDPKFQQDYAEGYDATSWFMGVLNEFDNKFKILPTGLKVTVATAIHAGDTTARFKISGKPVMGGNWYLPFSLSERFFCSDSFYDSLSANDKKKLSKTAETSYGIQLDINRKAWTGIGPRMSVDQLKIEGEAGVAITPVEFTFCISDGNFIRSIPANTDVSDWFRSYDWYYLDYQNDEEWIYCKLPEGLHAKIKNAVSIGDRSVTFVIYGTPTYGSRDCISFEIPAEGYVSQSGSAKAECGYEKIWFSGGGDFKYRYVIAGETNEPGLTVDNVHVSGVVGVPLAEDDSTVVTFRLHNCKLKKTLAKGALSLNGLLVDSKGLYAMEQYGILAKVERFNAGEDYFQIRLTGTPQKTGGLKFIMFLFEDYTDAGVRIKSKYNIEAAFYFNKPTIPDAVAYITGGDYEAQQGFNFSSGTEAIEVGIFGGVDETGFETKYRMANSLSFGKDSDVSQYFSGLPSGVKAYSKSVYSGGMESFKVYLKGKPEQAGTYKVRFKLISGQYLSLEKENIDENGRETWTQHLCDGVMSETYITITVNESSFGYAFDKSLGADTPELPYEDFLTTIDTKPIKLEGSITSQKYVVVENGTPGVETRSAYDIPEKDFLIYLPNITISSKVSAKAEIDFIRFKDGTPLSGYKFRSRENIEKGTYTAKTISVYLTKDIAEAVQSIDDVPVELQIKDGSTWHDITLPAGSVYDILQVFTTVLNPDTSKAKGLTATLSDCSINGISGSVLEDTEGFSITVSGDTFRAFTRGDEITSWLTNKPYGVRAIVKESIKAGETSTIKVQFAKVNSQNKIEKITPGGYSCTDPITVSIPFSALSGNQAGGKYSDLVGEVVAAVNEKAVYYILTGDDFNTIGKPMIVSARFTGAYNTKSIPMQKSENGKLIDYNEVWLDSIGQEHQFTYIYFPVIMGNMNFEESQDGYPFITYTSSENIFSEPAPADQPRLRTLDDSMFYSDITRVSQYTYVYKTQLVFQRSDIYAIRAGEGIISLKVEGENMPQFDPAHTYLSYKIYASAAEERANEQTGGDDYTGNDGGDDNGNQGDNGGYSGSGVAADPGKQPDIWVNGKDDKKNETYNKTLTKALSELNIELPDGCKWVVSVTDTTVTDVSGAYTSGKGKKNDFAKASYKKSNDGGNIVVTAFKKCGIARIWIAAVDKKKAVQASAYFDVAVGIAPKKMYLTKSHKDEKAEAVKSITLNMGDTENIFVNAEGIDLSSYSTFTWDTSKDTNNLLSVTPSKDGQSARIGIAGAPTDGKTKKVNISVICKESGKKVNISVVVSNAVKSVVGLAGTLQLDSAVETAVEATLGYSFETAAGRDSVTTDKIKVYVTTVLEEGSGYSVSADGKKFTQSSGKSKVKVTYKNGEFTLKAPKKTTDGTQVRVLIVATHADKTIDVFESGIITIGVKAND
ncbi:MAG: hypothetical protein J5824_10450 [Lachnospiraceae bacterium]|nr:hypothetical protein [Lachnospiraceae bacterium]